MSRRPLLHFPTRDDAQQSEPTLSEYRGTVVELPWPDFTGRHVLLAIDWNGQIFDQVAVASEEEAQRVTDRMTVALDAIRERQQGPQLMGAVVPLRESPSTPDAS